MRKIWKYNLTVGENLIQATTTFIPLHVGLDADGTASLWAEVEVGSTSRRTRVLVIGTGIEFEAGGLHYLGTFTQAPFVWHVYFQ